MTADVRLPDHIDTLLLDLDGTLLDLAFDTHFWLEVVPEYYRGFQVVPFSGDPPQYGTRPCCLELPRPPAP